MIRLVGGVGVLALVIGCGDDGGGGSGESGTSTSSSTSGSATDPATDPATGSVDSTDGGPSSATDPASSSGSADEDSTGESGQTSATTGEPSRCDYETVDGRIVIEAEDLPILEDWEILTTEGGYYAEGYIGWTGASHNNDPTHGVMSVTILVAEPGRYRLRWRNRIGMGANTTEHNDTWVKFPDAADYYGLQSPGADELRRYPRPRCEDADAMAAVEALPQVMEADCVEGSSTDGWFKVYSSGASDWSWSTRTNDNDAFDVMVEFDDPGDYTFMMAARADWHLIDRIVIHEEGLDDGTVEEPAAEPTACAG